jgi:pyridoxamine 5'-phosphate oxidase
MSIGIEARREWPEAAVERHLPEPLPEDPFPLLGAWYEEAHLRAAQPNPNAMTLATIEPDARGGLRPSARVVLCKTIEEARGVLVFYTNTRSAKGRALAANPHAAAVMHWDALARQVRVEGPVTRTSDAESDAYFRTRPWARQVGAWASEQSEPIESRGALQARLEAAMRRFGIDPANPPPPEVTLPIPRPPHWGGYRLWAERVELWVGSVARLHDRAVWTRALSPAHDEAGAAAYVPQGPWRATRLQP